jgi:hypothetical protein
VLTAERPEHPSSAGPARRNPDETSLEGWTPTLGPDLTLAEVIELAFDYRGNTTVVTTDGEELVGYVFNREATSPVPFIQMFDEAGEGPTTIPYTRIANIRFTGKDTAAGSSWKAWQTRKERDRAAASAHPDDADPSPDRT